MGVRRDCMRAQIGRELLRRIVEGEYRPGDRLIELTIAREFDSSQAPVREALRELEALRVVETEPYRGTRVRGVSARELAEASSVRGVLEAAAAPEAARTLCGRAGPLWDEARALDLATAAGDFDAYSKHNNRFHRLIVEAGGNGVMLEVWNSLMVEARTRLCLRAFKLDLPAISASHGPIAEALERGEGDAAARLLREHAELRVWGLPVDAPAPALPR